jgi:hypothetical protein
MKSASSPPFPVTRLGAGARDRDLSSPGAAVAFLSLTSRGYYRIPAGATQFMMGRDPARCQIVIPDCPEISGQHVLVHIEGDEVYVSDVGSTNGTRIDGFPSRRGVVRPGKVVAMAGHGVVLVSDQANRWLEELNVYVGRTKPLPHLLALPPNRHLILIGDPYTPLEQIARAAHHAVASDASPIVCVQAKHQVLAERRVLESAINGRIFVDGRGTSRRRPALNFVEDDLDRLRHPQQLTALTLGVRRAEDIRRPLLERDAFVLKVPTIGDRIAGGGLDDLIDAIYVKWEVPFRAAHWSGAPRDRIANFTWKKDHRQFTAVVVAVGRMWAGLGEHNAVEGLGASQTVKDWLTDLDLGWVSARAARPR